MNIRSKVKVRVRVMDRRLTGRRESSLFHTFTIFVRLPLLVRFLVQNQGRNVCVDALPRKTRFSGDICHLAYAARTTEIIVSFTVVTCY